MNSTSQRNDHLYHRRMRPPPDRDPTSVGHRLVDGHTIFAGIVGSRAHGLAGPHSDTDRRGIYAAPAELFWRLEPPPSHVDGPGEERVSWELAHFCGLALSANPTVLECLWTPLVESIDDTGRELVARRSAFLSRRVAATYGGYARAQLGKLEAARTGHTNGKQAMHGLRLLHCGLHVLRTGEILVDVAEHREELLAVRRGEVPVEEVRRIAAGLAEELVRAERSSRVPLEPDRRWVEEFLIRTRRASL
jgi:predicted nucleotidyltransferase